MKIVIAGVPRAGKTTYSEKLLKSLGRSYTAIHTDDLIMEYSWSEQAIKAAELLDREGNFLIEGLTMARALRVWLFRNSDNNNKPCDTLIWFKIPFEELTGGRLAAAKGALKVMNQILSELENRGVRILTR